MGTYNPTPIGSLTNQTAAIAAINENFNDIADVLSDKLDRVSGLPNQMGRDLDMNSNDILNVQAIQFGDGTVIGPGNPWPGGTNEGNVLVTAYKLTLPANTASVPLTTPAPSGRVMVYMDGLALVSPEDYSLGAGNNTLIFTTTFPQERELIVSYALQASTLEVDADNVTYAPAGVGAVQRTVQAKLRETVSVKDFGAVGDGVTDDTAAFQAAIAHLSANNTLRGGKLYVPSGHYILTDTLTFTSYSVDNAINIAFVGDGWLSTWLDFSTMTGSKDAVVVPNDQQFTMEGFFVRGGAGARDGVRLGTTGANGVSVFVIRDVRVQGFARDGFTHYNSYMGTMERCYSFSNGRDGFRMDGFHTSLSFITCYARNNTAGAGFRINGMVYSSFVGCGSDVNAWGFVGSNMRSTTFVSCGAEGNNQDGWLIIADNTGAPTSNPLFVQECYDVRGVELISCAGYGNNIGNAGYAGLVRVSATGVHTGSGTFNDSSPHVAQVVVRSCDANQSVPGTKAIVTAQSGGGLATVVEDGANFFPGGRTIGASTRHRNLSLQGQRCRLTLSADVSIANSTTTDVTWSAAADDIGGCWSAGSPTIITVPAGVSRVRFTVATGWEGNATGSRRFVMLNHPAGSYAVGLPRDDRSAAGFFNSTGFAAGDIISVTAGQQFRLSVEQSSGAALLLRSNTTFLTMEVIE